VLLQLLGIPVGLLDVVALHGQLMTAFGTTALQHFATAFGRHTLTEAVNAGAPTNLGLVCPFGHGVPPITDIMYCVVLSVGSVF
jgi:hypothetical protein